MIIQQFDDRQLSHYAYAIVHNQQMVLIDPARNPQIYYDFAATHQANIIAIIETHPHADFISSHYEIHQTTAATIYASRLLGAAYPHHTFDDGDTIDMGDGVRLKALNTPGHSPDSICVLLEENGNDVAIFTGDTLFIGDCGRPDLRENVGNTTADRHALATDMYHSLRQKIATLPAHTLVYPAHGAGSLCGKALSSANSSTIGNEIETNWSLQPQTEAEFVAQLTADQPFVPKYFAHAVAINKKGADNYQKSIENVPNLGYIYHDNYKETIERNIIVIDARSKDAYNIGSFFDSINLMVGAKFETWLGSIIAPHEFFYLTADTHEQVMELVQRIAKIGYENQIKGVFMGGYTLEMPMNVDYLHFIDNKTDYTIIDIRNVAEARQKPIFDNAIHIPLPQLRERTHEIPTDKPIVIHCAGGYRSAAGASILRNALGYDKEVYDFGESILDF